MITCPGDPRLEVRGVRKSFGGKPVIEDVSLSLGRVETVSLVGRSGVGKTTLFNIIAGLTQPDSGAVLLDGRDITGRIGQVGYMRQKDLLLPYKRVVDNVALPLIIAGEGKRAARAKASALFASFGLEGCENLYPGQLSGGMRQRAALLRTHLLSKDVALLDEPFSALDALTKGDMHRWFTDLAVRVGMSALFITHDIDEAVALSDRVVVLSGTPGRVVAEVAVDEPRPRAPDFVISDKFLAYKREVLACL